MGEISFSAIPSGFRVPGIFVELDDSQAGSSPTLTAPTLLLGQKTSSGTAPAAAAQKIKNKGQAVTLFGEGSHLAQMCERYLTSDRGADRDLRAMCIMDASGSAAAVGRFAFVGPATAAGELALMVGGRRVPVAVANADSSNTIATAANTALGAANDLAVTGAVVTSAVALKMKHADDPTINGKALYVLPGTGGIASLNCDNTGGSADSTVALSDATTVAVADNNATPSGSPVWYDHTNKLLCSVMSSGVDQIVLTSARLAIRIHHVAATAGLIQVYFDDDAAPATDRILFIDPGASDDTAPIITDYLACTARNAGTLGNSIDLRHSHYSTESVPAGVGVFEIPMNGGATDPTITALITAMGSQPYDVIIHPWAATTQLDAVNTEVERRWGPAVGLYGFQISAYSASVATTASLGNGRDKRFETIFGGGAYLPNPPWELAADAGGLVAQRMRTSPAPRDVKNLALSGCLPPRDGEGIDIEDAQTLLVDGISPLWSDSGALRICKFVADYQTDGAGSESEARRNAIHAFDDMRMFRYLRADLGAVFANKRVTTDAVTTAPNTVPLKLIEKRIDMLFGLFQAWGMVENLAAFLLYRKVEKDSTVPTRVNVLFPPDRCNPLDQIAVLSQARLDDVIPA